MLHEYAVDPKGLARLGPMWILMEQFGVSNGRVIAEFPSYWTRMVYDAMNESGCPDVQKLAIVERLKRLKASIANLEGPREYADAPWYESARIANQKHPFRAVISEVECSDIPNSLSPFTVTVDHPLWKVGEPPIPRTSVEIARCAGPLARISKHLLFVDPYLSSDDDRLRVVREILIASNFCEKEFQRIELHVTRKAGVIEAFATKVRDSILKEVPSRVEIQILMWDSKSDGDSMHPRYLLTERGGIRFDYGLSEGKIGQTTDVQLLDKETYESRWRGFQRETAAFDLVHEIRVSRSVSP